MTSDWILKKTSIDTRLLLDPIYDYGRVSSSVMYDDDGKDGLELAFTFTDPYTIPGAWRQAVHTVMFDGKYYWVPRLSIVKKSLKRTITSANKYLRQQQKTMIGNCIVTTKMPWKLGAQIAWQTLKTANYHPVFVGKFNEWLKNTPRNF